MRSLMLLAFVSILNMWAIEAPAEHLFDCSNTEILAEKEICRHQNLAQLDGLALEIYRGAIAQTATDEAFLEKWSKFIQDRNACGSSLTCIEAIYGEEITWFVKVLHGEVGIDGGSGYYVAARQGVLLKVSRNYGRRNVTEFLDSGMPVVVLIKFSADWWRVRSLGSGKEGWIQTKVSNVDQLSFRKYFEDKPSDNEKFSGGLKVSTSTPLPNCVDRSEYDAAIADRDSLKASMQEMLADNASRTAMKSDADNSDSSCVGVKDQLSAANSALAVQAENTKTKPSTLQADIDANYVTRSAYEAKVNEVEALNAAIADLKEATANGMVPRVDYDAEAQKLAAANQALADLNAKVGSDYISIDEYNQKAGELDAINKSLADLKSSIDSDYVEKSRYDQEVSDLDAKVAALNSSLVQQKTDADAELSRQVGALNSTIVDMQTRNDSLKKRLGQALSFMEECKANTECAAAMGLEQ